MAEKLDPTPFPLISEKADDTCQCCADADSAGRRDVSDFDCCGGPAPAGSGPWERPGYSVCGFVSDFLQTAAGPVPRVKTGLSRADRAGAARVRLGIGRERYRVSPGLYAVGRPDKDSPVLVTANYKLTFDALRRHLGALDAWIVVLDTCGINVWCAAGKGTFSTDEVVRRVESTGLAKVVDHRTLVLPQLGATGVSAGRVRRRSGFSVVWGPVRAVDLPSFFRNGMKAEAPARQVTFSLAERIVLIPVELAAVPKPSLAILAALFILSGIGPWVFSLDEAWNRGIAAGAAYLAGVGCGGILIPALLPWLPGRSFSVKGALVGCAAGVLVAAATAGAFGFWGWTALILLSSAVSSHLAMNFTGATPFTSPSGVEKEMRSAIPLQAAAALAAVAAWIGSAFTV